MFHRNLTTGLRNLTTEHGNLTTERRNLTAGPSVADMRADRVACVHFSVIMNGLYDVVIEREVAK